MLRQTDNSFNQSQFPMTAGSRSAMSEFSWALETWLTYHLWLIVFFSDTMRCAMFLPLVILSAMSSMVCRNDNIASAASPPASSIPPMDRCHPELVVIRKDWYFLWYFMVQSELRQFPDTESLPSNSSWTIRDLAIKLASQDFAGYILAELNSTFHLSHSWAVSMIGQTFLIATFCCSNSMIVCQISSLYFTFWKALILSSVMIVFSWFSSWFSSSRVLTLSSSSLISLQSSAGMIDDFWGLSSWHYIHPTSGPCPFRYLMAIFCFNFFCSAFYSVNDFSMSATQT